MRDPPRAVVGRVRGDRGRGQPAHQGRHPDPGQDLPRRPGRGRRDRHDRLRRVRLRRHRARRDRDHLPQGRGVAGPHQRPRSHHVHPGLAVHRHRRALRAAPRLAQGPARPHQDPVDRQRDRRPEGLGRAAPAPRRDHVAGRLGQRARPPAQPRRGQRRGGPRPEGGRLLDLPARRLGRHPARRRLQLRLQPRHRDHDRQRRLLRAARRRGHRPGHPQRVPVHQLDHVRHHRAGRVARPHPEADRVHPRDRAPADRLRADGPRRHRPHLVAALEHHALRQHRRGHGGGPGRRPDRARHRLDPDRVDQRAARAALRRRLQHDLPRRLLQRSGAVADGARSTPPRSPATAT